MIIMNVSVITIQVYGQYTHDNWGYIDSLIYENIEKKTKISMRSTGHHIPISKL